MNTQNQTAPKSPAEPEMRDNIVEIGTKKPIWDRFFTVAPLVLIGTTDEDGALDLAPKRMVTPMGWQKYF